MAQTPRPPVTGGSDYEVVHSAPLPPAGSDIWLALGANPLTPPTAPASAPPGPGASPFEVVASAPVPSAAPQPGVLGQAQSLVTSLIAEMNPIPGLIHLNDETAQILQHVLTGHLQAAGERTLNDLAEIATGLGKAQEAPFQEGWQSARKGQYAQAARHFVDWLLPIVGPRLDAGTNNFEQGQWGAGLGTIVGAGLNAALGAKGLMREAPVLAGTPAGPGAPPMAPRAPMPPDARAAMTSFADARGIPLTASEATGSRMAAGLEGLADHTIPGAVINRFQRGGQATAMMDTGRQLAAGVAPGSPITTTPEAGRFVSKALEGLAQTHAEEANAAYDQFRTLEALPANSRRVQVMQDATVGTTPIRMPVAVDMPLPADMRSLKPRATKLLAEIEGDPHWTLPRKQNSPAYGALLDIVNGADYVPASRADKLLSAVKTIAREQGGVAKAIQADLEHVVQRAVALGGDELQTALRTGREAWATKKHIEALLEDLQQGTKGEPVKLVDRLTVKRDGAIETLKELRKTAPQTLPVIGRTFLEEALDSVPGPTGTWEHGAAAASKFEHLGAETKRLLFGADALDDLTQFFKLAREVNQEYNKSRTAYVAWIAEQARGIWYDPLTGLAEQVGSGGLAKLLWSKRGRRAFVRAMKTPRATTAPSTAAAAGLANAARELRLAVVKVAPVVSSGTKAVEAANALPRAADTDTPAATPTLAGETGEPQ